jgi:lipopolysaccharide/colanic/teichoic acid biosynthesis glycosyltransferase
MGSMAADPMALSPTVPLDAAPTRVAERPSDAADRTVTARRRAGRVLYAAAKRSLDVVVSGILLTILLPLFVVIGLAILREGGGPIFYRGDRVGRHGRTFRVLKFRSMRAGCDQAAHAAFVRDLLRGSTSCELYKVPDDARITPFGAFLRRTSLDELPQLWNVLRGDMSLVGPRPDVPYAVADYASWMRERLAVRPGMTGLWQVSGRSRRSLLEMYQLDVAYVARASLRMDLRILLRTVPVVLGGDGAA